ncbi:hypothetical protein [Geodermatophilus sp. SYSU D00766]
MTQPGEQSDGDYSYDLVHEATAGSGRQPVPPAPAEPPAPADEDPGGDLGYDEVHRG